MFLQTRYVILSILWATIHVLMHEKHKQENVWRRFTSKTGLVVE